MQLTIGRQVPGEEFSSCFGGSSPTVKEGPTDRRKSPPKGRATTPCKVDAIPVDRTIEILRRHGSISNESLYHDKFTVV